MLTQARPTHEGHGGASSERSLNNPQNGVAAYFLERPPGVGSTRREDTLRGMPSGNNGLVDIGLRPCDISAHSPAQLDLTKRVPR